MYDYDDRQSPKITYLAEAFSMKYMILATTQLWMFMGMLLEILLIKNKINISNHTMQVQHSYAKDSLSSTLLVISLLPIFDYCCITFPSSK
jgi:membrane-associated HD superfamily phosphohydrolase